MDSHPGLLKGMTVMGDPSPSPVHEVTLLGFQTATLNVLLTGVEEKSTVSKYALTINLFII